MDGAEAAAAAAACCCCLLLLLLPPPGGRRRLRARLAPTTAGAGRPGLGGPPRASPALPAGRPPPAGVEGSGAAPAPAPPYLRSTPGAGGNCLRAAAPGGVHIVSESSERNLPSVFVSLMVAVN